MTPAPVHAPVAHPAHAAHLPPPHCESFVHQHVTPAAAHLPVAEVTVLQLPVGHAHEVAADVTEAQLALSAGPVPVQVPVHWVVALTHLPLAQSESATHTQAVLAGLGTGAGESVVVHAATPAVQGTDDGAASQPWPSSVPVPVQLEQLPLLLLGMQWPVSHTASLIQ